MPLHLMLCCSHDSGYVDGFIKFFFEMFKEVKVGSYQGHASSGPCFTLSNHVNSIIFFSFFILRSVH